MVQVKKAEIRDAIIDAAAGLFADKGYVDTTMVDIAKRARISNANIYSYFGSKFEVFFCVYETWFRAHIKALESRINKSSAPRERLGMLLTGLLREIPAADNGFANNLIQALSTVKPKDPYDPRLVVWLRGLIAEVLNSSLPSMRRSPARRARMAHLIVIAFDGAVVNYRVNPSSLPSAAMVDELVDLLFTG